MKQSRPLLLSKPVVAVCLSLAFCLAAGTAALSVFSIRALASATGELARARAGGRADDLVRIQEMITQRLSAPELFPGSDRAAMEELRRFLDASGARETGVLATRVATIRERSLRLQAVSFAMLGLATLMAAAGFILFIRRVNELETMITVCAWTHRVKYRGKWLSFEDYLHERFQLEATHGISEDAAKKLMLEELELHPGLRGAPPERQDAM